jgi:D-alanyl-lipoteichoic acid acyltransferase DltB (MBOAT superfamily)
MLLDAGAKAAKKKPPLSADEIRRLGRAHRKDERFTSVVGQYWAAMTADGALHGGSGVNFILYEKVHMRISKTLTKGDEEFTEEDAMQVALGFGRIITSYCRSSTS